MQRDLIIKGRGLGGSADLTLLAPIKPGFVDSLESVTYKTRIKRVLDTLHGARTATHEYQTARLLSDSVERVGAIHSVRVAVLEPEDKVLLAVTFDGSWEAYIRVLWDKVGTLLDLIFCGTVDYVTAHDHAFDEWLAWARRVQVETGFFYGPAESTARDALYQRRVERMRVSGSSGSAEVNDIQAVLPSAEQEVERLVNPPNPLQPDDPPIVPVTAPRMVRERIRVGIQGLAALYRLTDLHRPSTPDGDVLRRAALDLLHEFVRMRDLRLIDKELDDERLRFERQLDWLFPSAPSVAALEKRQVPPSAADNHAPIDPATQRDVQGGILRAYEKITHGLVLMLAFDNTAALRDFLRAIDLNSAWLTRDGDSHQAAPDRVFRNLALTLAGLRMAGLDEDALELFPEEFRQGMAARAGTLGDVRNNHPRRWRLPHRFTGIDTAPGSDTIELGSVHAVLQLRCASDDPTEEVPEDQLKLTTHPLRADVQWLLDSCRGLQVLAAQPLRRRYQDFSKRQHVITEHFGYADGNGQPEIEPGPVNFKRNRIHLGEIVLGHDNAADFTIDLADPSIPEAVKARQRWLTNGSFLAMRKYRQYVDRLKHAVDKTAKVMEQELGDTTTDFAEIIYAKLMGRTQDGTPLVPVQPGENHLNAFTYDLDANGARCPLHAHIRRAHPRMKPGEMMRPPRLIRRGMAYGPQYTGTPDDVDRGLLFMAYNANLGEQFEVVQRWLSGGNSTGASSGQSCPFLGVPENGLSRHFRFEHADRDGRLHVFRVELEDGVALFDAPPVLTRLDWGLYLFTPSLSALRHLFAVAASAAVAGTPNLPWQTPRGRTLVAALKKLEETSDTATVVAAWKAAIEDPESIDRLDSAAVWAAIREDHGGVLKTPYGVLVASRSLVSEVFRDAGARYSICGQLARMKRSIGEVALGMDEGPVYRQLADPVNAAIGMLKEAEVFELTFTAATRKLDAIVDEAKRQSLEVGDARFEVGFEAREVIDEVLVDLCEAWFGLDDDPLHRFLRGSADWAWQRGQPPLYPGHFTALSRYMFQPHPGATVAEIGELYGQALREAMRSFVEDHRAAHSEPRLRGTDLPAPIAHAIFNHPTHGGDNDFVARTMVGVLMGFIAPVIGAVLNVLREWQRDASFSALRTRLARRTGFADAHAILAGPMMAAARMRPMPQLNWRTALKPHRLGLPDSPHAVDIATGDKIVLASVSATQQSLADGQDDGWLMFGGERTTPGQCPTHACPGRTAGTGAMLGTLAALLAWPGASLRAGAAPLSFLLEGASGFPPSPSAGLEGPRSRPPAPPRRTKNRSGLILAWGDSWLDRSIAQVPLGTDVRDWLDIFGYTVPQDFCKYSVWPKVVTMAASPEEFCAYLDSALLAPESPVALMLSAGGNDSTGDTLSSLLNEKAPDVPMLKPDALDAHIAGLRASYVVVLNAIKQVLDDQAVRDIPVIVHGYDYPIPAGKSLPGMGDYAKRWLFKPFQDKGYTDEGAGATGMRTLIDALNAMLSNLAQLPAYCSFVRYVDLRKTIESTWPTATQGWADDLHPTNDAFELLAEKIDAEIQRHRIRTGTPTAALD